ncbi:MAG: acyl-phosphate glycerol 3-phosphate acyltransferase [Elusimicrobia bacterium RIFOXYA2_FULL_40_6]|nr:MAG: acyl-phosphate glycerol 3-phosphate acyltransferase [Elusimicrobia bacterium RIFOXYA2_FULL_40_6]
MQNIILITVTSYLLGSVPTAYLFAKIIKGIDIRKHGSGNPGATNVFRTVGKTAGIIVFTIDMMKGFLAVYLVSRLFNYDTNYSLLAGIAAIAGHNWTVWLSFKGGKGVATGAGVVFALLPISAASGVAVFFVLLLSTKYVSLSSIVSSAVVAIVTWLYPANSLLIKIVITLLCSVIILRHKSNILRLAKGEEPKIKL